MFEAFKQRRALSRWQKSTLGKVLLHHGHEYFWQKDAVFGYMDEETKLRHCAELHGAAMTVMESENPFLAERALLAEYVLAFAPLMVIGMKAEGKREQELYADTPFISGELRPHTLQIAELIDELGRVRFDNPNVTTEELGDFCTTRASLLLFYCNGANLISIHVEDRANGNGEWFRAYVQAAMVWAEDWIRKEIGLPSLVPSPVGGLVYSSFMNYVTAGEPDPFYAWCKDFPDYYLWGHGPKPD